MVTMIGMDAMSGRRQGAMLGEGKDSVGMGWAV